MARAENPIEKYGMSRYDVANRKPRGQEGTFQNRSGNQARDEAQSAARETVAPTFSELQSQGRARPAMPSPTANVAQMFGGAPASFVTDQGTPQPQTQGPAPSPIETSLEQALGQPQSSRADEDTGWQTILGNLKAQFSDRRENLNTDLARRGLWSSSGDIGASGALGRLDADNNRTIASAQLDYRNQRENQRNEILRILAPLLLGGR